MGRTLDFTDFSGGLDTEAALIYDAVHLFAVALRQVREAQNLRTMSIECGPFPQSWPHGSTINNFMRLSNIPGLTGDVRFDAWGRRSQFSLDLLNLFEEHDLAKVGAWDKVNGVSLPGLPTDGQGSKEEESPMMNKSLVVTTIINAPYTMIRVSQRKAKSYIFLDRNTFTQEESGVLLGNARYEGFIPDMVDIISKVANFTQSFVDSIPLDFALQRHPEDCG